MTAPLLHQPERDANVVDWVGAKNPSVEFSWNGQTLYQTCPLTALFDQDSLRLKNSGRNGRDAALGEKRFDLGRDGIASSSGARRAWYS